MLQCGDAPAKQQFKSSFARKQIYFPSWCELVDKPLSSPHAKDVRKFSGGAPQWDAYGSVMMLNIISTVISGLVVGILARYFYPGAVNMGWGLTILLGIGGSLLAGLVVSWQSKGGIGGGLNGAGFIASLIGAMALIFIGRQF